MPDEPEWVRVWPERSPGALEMFVIYISPRDAPGLFVVRRWEVLRDGPEPQPREAQRAVTLEGARALLREGRVRLERNANDDPSIVEVWL